MVNKKSEFILYLLVVILWLYLVPSAKCLSKYLEGIVLHFSHLSRFLSPRQEFRQCVLVCRGHARVRCICFLRKQT